jgi:EAL domain-containing protein (putative c-di-GMP-specific phosphodiesterase class I)
LRDLPVSRLKIDRTFIRGVAANDNDARLVKAVIVLAQSLGKSVVAEGVETPAQLDFVRAHGGHSYQGWLFSKAVPAHQVPALMRRGPALRAERVA